jgi:hypothetical protein
MKRAAIKSKLTQIADQPGRQHGSAERSSTAHVAFVYPVRRTVCVASPVYRQMRPTPAIVLSEQRSGKCSRRNMILQSRFPAASRIS